MKLKIRIEESTKLVNAIVEFKPLKDDDVKIVTILTNQIAIMKALIAITDKNK